MKKSRAEADSQPEANAMGVRLVGIGASAGGLEALRELMESLPDSDVLSYVIAQHVSPTHVSMMMSLLAPLTSLRVQDLVDQQSPEPGVIYITPPNKDVVLEHGLLHLTEPQAAIGPKPSVNHFFHSLADELGEQSIGIILSGTGTDGAAGIRAIKAVGGITIAQEPETAKYDGMPKAAIHTGSVDLILAPDKIGPALERLLSLPRDLQPVIDEALDTDEYSQISSLVRVNTAFKLNDYKPATVQRRIARRMSILGIGTLKEYVEHLKANREESLFLMRDTFIGVTSFFRDPDAFFALERVIGEIVQKRGEIIRCWVPACSSGEEVYSIAMLFEEALRNQGKASPQYVIFASDLDDDAVERARAALYSVSELKSVPKSLRELYTEVVGEHCRINKGIRNRVVFARQNVIEDPPFAHLDLISCRNLLIYLNQPVQKRVLEVFHYSLNSGGYLFLGKSETVEQHNALFEAVNNRMRLYRRQDGVSHYAPPLTKGVSWVQPGRQEGRRNIATSTDLISMRTLEELTERYAPPSLVINIEDCVVHFHGDLKPYLSFPKGRANMYLFELVDASLRAELRALVYRCRRDLQPARGSAWPIDIGGQPHTVVPMVSPLEPDQKALLLISFQATRLEEGKPVTASIASNERDNLIISELEQELANTRSHLNVVVEELETSNEELQSLNEELQSTNEELQSTNEELQTSNEELQSTNEELLTVNEELQVKSTELETTANDLINVKESLTFPLVVVDAQLRITQFNSACSTIVVLNGLLEGCFLASVQWLVEVPGLTGQVRRVLQDGQHYRTVVRTMEDTIYELLVIPYRLSRGEIAGAVLVFKDITTQHEVKVALQRSNERYDLAVRGSSDGLWDWDIAADVFYMAPRFKEILGYRAEEMESSLQAWEMRLHPDDQAATHAAVEGSLKDGKPYDAEYRLRHKSGDYIWIRARGQVVARDETGKSLRMAGSITDITDRKEAELALRESEARISRIIEIMPEAILVIDEQGSIQRVNTRAEQIFGYTRAQLLGQPVEILVPERFRVTHVSLRHEYAANPTMRPMGMGRYLYGLHKDGREIPVEVALAPLLDGRAQYFIVSVADITERRQAEQALRESEEKFLLAMRHAPVGMALVAMDGSIVEVNPALCRILGYTEVELVARDFKSITHADDLASDLAYVDQLLTGQIETYQLEKRYIHKDGRVVWVQLNVALVRNEAGKPRYYIFQIQDTTQRKLAEDELQLAASVFSNSLDGIFITSQDGTILKVNRAFERITGYRSEEAVGKNMRLLRSDRQAPDFYREMWNTIKQTGGWQGEIWDRHKDGHVIPLWLSTSSVHGGSCAPDRYIAIMYDISEQKMSQERINYLAYYDALTGLPNRSLFMDRLSHALTQAKRQRRTLALLFIDLDNFKHINDTYGHPVGDEVLCQVAERLRKVTRESDSVARLSGDEFTLLIEDAADTTAVSGTAQKILKLLAEPIELGSRQFFISASIGIACFPEDGGDLNTLVKHADLAMYRSKEGGRNQWHFYSQEMGDVAQEWMVLYNDLRFALDQRVLELYFQPIMNVGTRQCVGAEALARWSHQDRGWIPPNKFIALAEETPLIHPLGEWILRTACLQMKAWLEAGIPLNFMAVNVSGKQIMKGDFVAVARQVLAETGCPAERITLELTESFIMHENKGAITLLNELRDLGFGIAIDDFGTGYSSLAYLKRLPVTKLKLDQSFVRDIPGDANDVAIARAILRLGESVGLEVVAEGVETKEQHNFVLSEGCALSQGYLYANPMPAIVFQEYMEKIRR